MGTVAIAIAVLAIIGGWLIFGDRVVAGEPKNEIEYWSDRIGAQFDELEDLGYDTSGPLEWKYVFMHREYEPLAEVWKRLRNEGYTLVASDEIRESENEIVEHKIIVSKVEAHSLESLIRRNLELKDLASRCGVDIYNWGWVVDPDRDSVPGLQPT